MKAVKPILTGVVVAMLSAYAFAVLHRKFGPFPGLGDDDLKV